MQNKTIGGLFTMTTYCLKDDVNNLFGDISDSISDAMFATSIENAGAWIDSALLSSHVPVPLIVVDEIVISNDADDEETDDETVISNDTDNEETDDTSLEVVVDLTETDTPVNPVTQLALTGVPSILKSAAIYFAASDILMSLYHGDEYKEQMDFWFNKATALLKSYIDSYKAESNTDGSVAHRRASTYMEKRIRRNRRCY